VQALAAQVALLLEANNQLNSQLMQSNKQHREETAELRELITKRPELASAATKSMKSTMIAGLLCGGSKKIGPLSNQVNSRMQDVLKRNLTVKETEKAYKLVVERQHENVQGFLKAFRLALRECFESGAMP
jgi:hypothetical protein